MTNYYQLSKEFLPKRIKTLIIAESPSENNYFYFKHQKPTKVFFSNLI